MANKDLVLKPHKILQQDIHRKLVIDPRAWWYELNYGIEIIQPIIFKNYHEIRHLIIPWQSIRAALKRKDK